MGPNDKLGNTVYYLMADEGRGKMVRGLKIRLRMDKSLYPSSIIPT